MFKKMKKALIFSLLFLLSCAYKNLDKYSEGTCQDCYSYLLKNCQKIAKKDTIKELVTVTINGFVLTVNSNLNSPCDSLFKYRTNPLINGDSTIEVLDKKQNGVEVKQYLNKKNGNLKTVIKQDTLFVSKTVYLPYACITSWYEVSVFLKNRVNFYFKKYRYWLLLAIILISIAYFKLR